MKIVTILGARPQFVKAAVVSREILKNAGIREVIIHTGQHYDKNMSDIFFEEMEIPSPDYNLNINGLSHGAMTGEMLKGIESILLSEKPDYVMVYGDTNSTIAGALAAKKIHIKVAHVEAGLRSFNIRMPEEVNRILTDRISDKLYCPTQTAVDNLLREGYAALDGQIHKTGDVMLDAALFYSRKAKEKSAIIDTLGLDKFILCTIHRAENTDDLDRLRSIVNAINEIAGSIRVVVPIHPRTRNILAKHDISVNFDMIDPVGYFDMLNLITHCSLVMTDSGGLQKEAFYFKKNCVTLRDETEWVELIDNGFAVCVGSDTCKILEAYHGLLHKDNDFSLDLYGKGDASEKIVAGLFN
ncbi:non-hydrolyzing UDP-N-acetylglucosamine 2-epimerase [Chitinophaga pinensis]|uniref:UDP-N-acetylglucosamine 2-epimerase n=1 Tax=Chitinophaga pinensis (strain ATCC 43595 / DSM 2588 / LMG 13176 / NBRC 15968 / NCIMB 11800 / UQM 2034) TaxID=485918 RepID=A0A979G7R7_CHIPD|nr:UDP-N-acetylglucosamine 2-epimerase (non-hydrolyzing) [Chitinophaga pinensis]ACU62192.1 UDP-N-acetylglucosamine 2-epimerase [Chitinophaga pinensis DSM 2588]